MHGVAVNEITGDEGIISSTESVTEDYKIEQYREQLEQLARSIIVKDSLLGNVTTVTSMAEDMKNENWISSAIADEENDDIIVTTTDGYEYQVIYIEETGELYIESLGEADGKKLPTLSVSYDIATGTINANASAEDGISRIELIYRGEVIQSVTTDTASFKIENTGMYTVRAVSNAEKVRYVKVRVTGILSAPNITITTAGEEENGWYGKDNVEVKVEIKAANETTKGIYYRKNTEPSYTYTEEETTTLTINTSGRTVIYAYAVDSTESESGISSLAVQYDNIAPSIGELKVSPEAPSSGWYTTDVEISLANATDSNSGIAGYYYWEVVGTEEVQDEDKTYVNGISRKVTIQSEGEKVLSFQVKDNAGNLSGITTITVKKDSIAPNDFSTEITNETTTSFTINAGTTDDTSGMEGYYFYVDGTVKNSEISTSGTYEVTGLSPNKSYTVYVEAVDKAGNKKKSTSIIGKTKGELLTPTISLSGTSGANGYYTGDVTVTIQDSASESTTGATQIKYTVAVAGANAISETIVNGRSTSFTITTDGTSTINAYVVGSNGSTSETSTKGVNKDATAPAVPTFSITSGTAGNNGWYRSNVTVKITAGSDSTSGAYQIRYKVTGATTIAETTITGTTQSVTITGDGTSTITAYTIDKAGNVSSSATYTINKDATAPAVPTFSLTSGTAGNNGWYVSDVTVKITAGSDSTSGAYQIRYKVTGATTVAETTITGTTQSVTITVDGTSTITAYTIDKAGNVSSSASYTIKKDTTPPVLEFTLSGNNIFGWKLEFSMSDNCSGLAALEYVDWANSINGTTVTIWTVDEGSVILQHSGVAEFDGGWRNR